jgi:hypothetical protein
MGKEVVVTEMLSKEMIEAGANFLRHLDASNDIIIDDAFWRRESDEDDWHLVLVSPGVAFTGTRQGYSRMFDVLDNIPDPLAVVKPQNVTLLDSWDPEVKALRSALSPFDIPEGYRITKVWLGNHYFEDLYIYRIIRTVMLTCPIDLKSPIGASEDGQPALIHLHNFNGVPAARVVAHGTLRVVGEKRFVEIELPEKYGITNPAQIICKLGVWAVAGPIGILISRVLP